MRAKIFLTLLLLIAVDSVKAQSGIKQLNSDQIIVLINKNNQRIKELYIGDIVKLELTNSTKVKGTIMLIDSTSMTVDNQQISFDELLKFSTRKTWVRILGGGLLLSGMIISLSQSLESIADPVPSDLTLVSIPLYGAGLALVLSNYHEIDNYMLVVVPDQ